jgi:hypothetical protein
MDIIVAECQGATQTPSGLQYLNIGSATWLTGPWRIAGVETGPPDAYTRGVSQLV